MRDTGLHSYPGVNLTALHKLVGKTDWPIRDLPVMPPPSVALQVRTLTGPLGIRKTNKEYA